MYARIHGKSPGRLPEDEITSCVFGPLRMMAETAPGRTWAACLHLFECSHLFPEDFEPMAVDVRFWPRFPSGQRGYIEPDVHIVARCGADLRTILVEVKCRADLGNNQLLEQWTRIQVPDEGSNAITEGDDLRSRSVHVLLGYVRPRHRSDIDAQEAQARETGVPWVDRLITTTWGQFTLQVKELRGLTEPMRKDVLQFLRKELAVVPVPQFEGIELAHLASVSEEAWFFRRFGGVRWRDLRAVPILRWAFRDASATT